MFWGVTVWRLLPILLVLMVVRFGSAMAVITEYLIMGGYDRTKNTYTWTVYMYDTARDDGGGKRQAQCLPKRRRGRVRNPVESLDGTPEQTEERKHQKGKERSAGQNRQPAACPELPIRVVGVRLLRNRTSAPYLHCK